MRIQAALGFLLMVGPVLGQSYQRQATIVGGGSFDQGKCVIEVQVDAMAEVQLRGTAGILRNLAGQAPRLQLAAYAPGGPVAEGWPFSPPQGWAHKQPLLGVDRPARSQAPPPAPWRPTRSETARAHRHL